MPVQQVVVCQCLSEACLCHTGSKLLEDNRGCRPSWESLLRCLVGAPHRHVHAVLPVQSHLITCLRCRAGVDTAGQHRGSVQVRQAGRVERP